MGSERELPMFPLSSVLFPGELLPLHVFEQRYRTMMARCLESEPHLFGVVLIARGSEVGGGDTRTDVGTVARIEALSRSEDGRYAVLVRGTDRLHVRRWMPDDPYPLAVVEVLTEGPDPAGGTLEEARSSVRRVEALLSELGRSPAPVVGGLGESAGEDAPEGAGSGDAEGAEGDEGPDSAWGLCRRLPLGPMDRQRLLAADEAEGRLRLLVELARAQAEDLLRLLSGG